MTVLRKQTLNNIDVSKKLDELYKRIPTFECKVGCTECCGPVIWHPAERAKFSALKVSDSINCPYSLCGFCEEYENRPLLCRLFGTSDRMPCPYCGPPKRLTVEETDQIMKEYVELMKECDEHSPKKR